MRAIVHTRYGSPDLLELREVDRPVPKDREVLIRVHATSVNDWEMGLLEGKPLFMRAAIGWTRPKVRIMGCDVAGVVEAVGSGVTRFQLGDAVYGDVHACGFGAFAEYLCADENALEPKPEVLSFEEAAAMPHGATLAWQALHDKGELQSGEELLINGAGGGVGPLALQLAKSLGVEATGVDSGEKLPMLRSLGFDHVLDYREQDFTGRGQTWDLILDVKTTRSPFAYSRALKPGGRYVTVGGSMPRIVQLLLCSAWIARTKQRHLRLLGLQANRGLAEMAPLIEDGKIVPVIAGPYALDQAPEALKLFASGRQQGRIVITVSSERS
jgi:NADPH:quinone reductase-like Zn-dependent oxidoreductase